MRQIVVVQRVVGVLLMLFSTSMLPPVLLCWIYGDSGPEPFFIAFLVTFSTGFVTWWPQRRSQADLKLRDGFLVVVLFWTVLGLFGAIPLYLSALPDLSVTDAVFESVSGLTTTGATILTGIDDLPKGILYYRQQLQWLGGMGIIVLAVAVLPMLGVGGMQLYRAETPGPIKDSKLTPRITETAKALWMIYMVITLSCAIAYFAAGMSLFDAVGHAFSTVAIGGFSTHDASMGYFKNPVIEAVAILFMVISGINFAVHFGVWKWRSLRPYGQDSEVRVYLLILLLLSVITASVLFATRTFGSVSETLLTAIFQVVSIGTTTGFTTSEYYSWPIFLPVLLLFASFVGACAGSTGGGMKVIRFLLLFKQGTREIQRLVHPNAEFPVKIGGKTVPSHVVEAVWGFFSAYVALFAIMLLILMATGLDQVSAFAAVAACLNNLGPGLGDVAANFSSVNDVGKWTLVAAMLFGRLEIFTLLVVFTPTFWRR